MKPPAFFALLALALGVPASAFSQVLDDPSLTAELVTSGLAIPTSMAFVAPDDILVLEKDTARVRRVLNGVTIAPTAIVFPHGSSLGPAYDDVAIVGDFNLQQLYALPLNGARTGFDIAGIPGLADLVADDPGERDALRFGTGFLATDLEVGPDGHLYVLRIFPGAITRIRGPGPATVPALPAWGAALLPLLLGAAGLLYARLRRL
jgi:glucose/arabinose dehydrogenase